MPFALLLSCWAGLSISACSPSAYKVGEIDSGSDSAPDAGLPGFPMTGIGSSDLNVTSVEPASGTFAGGDHVVVRGSGFPDDVTTISVRIDGHLVQPSDTKLDGKGRIAIVTPAGEVGPADVSVTIPNKDTAKPETATLKAGFYYNALAVVPASGSLAGNTQVEIDVSGATLDDKVQINFDGKPCTALVVLTPQRARCKTPAHALGAVDVIASWPGVENNALLGKQAFTFVDTSDTDLGGLSGGALGGTLNVTVVDSGGGNVIPEAFVLVGDDPKGKYKGLTDARGAITFSGDDLKGRVTVHAAKKCFERSSIVTFDAQNVTLFLSPILDLSCAASGSGDGGHGQLGALVSGELIFPGSDEFAINAWEIVPKPRAGEQRVTYVFTTTATSDSNNPSPDVAGTTARLEEGSALKGVRGYPYKIFARPAGLAVYAIAGLERTDTGEFTPYAMGVARNVVTSPGDETTNVDIEMTITLDHELDVSLSGLPKPTATGPTDFVVSSYVDLGGEGVIVRRINGVSLDKLTRYDPSASFRFLGQPAFTGPLADASYQLVAEYKPSSDDYPYTDQHVYGVKQLSKPLVLSGFLGFPVATSPRLGEQIPKDRTLRFELEGADPDLFLVELIGGDGNPAWSQILPGSARSVPIPDLSGIKGQTDIAAGFIRWTVTAVNVDDFKYDEFQYNAVSPRLWTHSSGNAFTMHR